MKTTRVNVLTKFVGKVGLFEVPIETFEDVEKVLGGFADIAYLDCGITLIYRAQTPEEHKNNDVNMVMEIKGIPELFFGNCLFCNEVLPNIDSYDEEFKLEPLTKEQVSWIVENTEQGFIPFKGEIKPVLILKYS